MKEILICNKIEEIIGKLVKESMTLSLVSLS